MIIIALDSAAILIAAVAANNSVVLFVTSPSVCAFPNSLTTSSLTGLLLDHP